MSTDALNLPRHGVLSAVRVMCELDRHGSLVMQLDGGECEVAVSGLLAADLVTMTRIQADDKGPTVLVELSRRGADLVQHLSGADQ